MPFNNQKFNNWLKYREITLNSHHGTCFDTEKFLKSNGNTQNYEEEQSFDKFDPITPNNSTLKFPPRIEQSINNYLEKLNELAITEEEVLNDLGEPLIQSIRETQGNLEPAWSSTKICNPAELLLPNDHRLFVTTKGPEYSLQYPYEKKEDISFKNQLMCNYGKYVFIVERGSINVYEQRNLRDPVIDFNYINAKLLKNQYYLYNMTNRDYKDVDDPYVDESELGANYMCIKKLFDRDVLIVCLMYGLVVFYDLESITNDVRRYEKKHVWDNNFDKTVPWSPVVSLKVPESCWSIDIININNVAFIAAGHNLPGVSLFAIKKEKNNYSYNNRYREYDFSDTLSNLQKHYCDNEGLHKIDRKDSRLSSFTTGVPTCSTNNYNTISRELFSEHNVPSVTFITPDQSITKNITLVYGSIFGNITTVDIDTDISSGIINVKLLDIQFFGEQVWNVTALKKKDFLSVSQFELLCLNFQEKLKQSIQKSIIMDSKILNFQPKSVYNSGNYGIGTLTTQIPVPTTNLNWLCLKGIKSSSIQLNFTTFDKKGLVSKGELKDQISNYGMLLPSLDERPLESMERITCTFENDTLSFTYKYPNYLKKNFKEDPKELDLWKQSNLEITLANDTKNRSDYRGYIIVSNHKSHNFRQLDISYSHDFTYKSKSSPSNSTLEFPKEPIIYAASAYFHKDYKRPTWKDILNSDAEIPDKPNDCFNLEEDETYKQRAWWVHNHALKVKKLLDLAISGHEPCGFTLPKFENDILLVTTEYNIYLVKPSPLIITSYTVNEIFPLENASICSEIIAAGFLNRINFVCHIKELNCIAVASQVGLVSLLRLTEFRGIYSFRQEYILGWKYQNPYEDNNLLCNRYYITGENISPCLHDDTLLPLAFIIGMDYTYFPENKSAGVSEYVELIVTSRCNKQKFKIFAGETIGEK
ncbi:Crt10p PWA37_004255 [Arxiozyma heterogenica]|uniref:Crt10p n=1 Tax=Arxiozyma heterogenica TaxID=278026 RepID=UPI002F0E3A8A